MKYLTTLLIALFIASCSTNTQDDGCFDDKLVKIIDYHYNLVYQLQSVYVYPTQHYDVEEGETYTWCVDDNRAVLSVH